MRKLLLASFIFLNISLLSAYAQKEFNNWYFGQFAGVTFNTKNGEPVAVDTSAMPAKEGCASVSDPAGNLLFYTNGGLVWNKKHKIMLDSKYLKGGSSSTQSATIVQKPGNKNIYYIFTCDEWENQGNFGICYSIVDMTLDYGLGAITQKNVFLYGPSVEKLTAAKHANGKDAWIISHKWGTNQFYAYLLTENGIADTPVVSSVGIIYNKNKFPDYRYFPAGYLKVSPKGDRIAAAFQYEQLVEVFKFDNSKGIISNPNDIDFKQFDEYGPYGIEFSPDNSKLFVLLKRDTFKIQNDTIFNSYIFQYELDSNNSIKNIHPVSSLKDGTGAMQLGPNQKIYVTQVWYDKLSNYLGCIETPNEIGIDCNFVRDAVPLKNGYSVLGLPNSLVVNKEPFFINVNPTCDGEDLILEVTLLDSGLKKFEWTGPNGFKSKEARPIIKNAGKINEGVYRIEVWGDSLHFVDSLMVDLIPLPDFKILPGKEAFICDNDSLELKAEPFDNYSKYSWSTGEIGRSIIINSPGVYSLTVENSYGCQYTDSVIVKSNPKPKSEIFPESPVLLCVGDSATLQAATDDENNKFFWSTGDTSKSIKVTKAGKYFLTVESIAGCRTVDSAEVIFNPMPKVEIHGNTKFCQGDSIILTSKYVEEGRIFWSTGDTTQSITVSKAGIYILTAENTNGCRASDTVEVTVSPIPEAEIEGTTTICEGDSTVLSSKYSDSGYKYSWSTGQTTKDITVNNSGTYILIIENESGCRAADTAIVNVVPSINPKITTSNGRTSLCEGETIKLLSEPKGSGYTYLWSTGQTTPDIEINNEGSYSVTISLNGKCEGTNSIYIKVNPNPVVVIEGSASICSGNELALRTGNTYSSYSWSTGETTREIKVTKPGSYSVTVTDTNGCSASVSIDVKESDIIITGLSDIDFGRICSGETAEKELTIRNEGKDSIYIKDVNFKQSTGFKSTLVAGGVLPNSTLSVNFTFSPQQIGYYKDTVLITTDYPCQKTLVQEIKGTAYAKTLVFLPDTTVSIGDNIAIPMKTELVCGNFLPFDAQYQSEINFNASALFPDPTQEPGVTNSGIIAGERMISISGTGTKSIKGQVMLALQDSIPLIIKSFNWNNDLIENETKNGILRIKGLCQQNLSKIKMMNELVLSVVPSPASDESEIVVTGDAKGTMSVVIYSIEGIKKGTVEINKTGFEARKKLNLKEYSSGVYQLILQSGGECLNVPMVVVR